MAGDESPCEESSEVGGPETATASPRNRNIDENYDPHRGAHVAHCDWSVVSPSYAVVEMVAALTDRSETDVSPLAETVDPDAIDAMLSSSIGETRVRFVHDGVEVTVTADGTVTGGHAE